MLGGRDGVETGIKRLEVTVLRKTVLAGIEGAFGFGL